MQKELLKQYLIEAIDALSEEEIALLSPSIDEPDLYSVMSEITTLSGEVKKMNNLSMKLSNSVQTVLESVVESTSKEDTPNEAVMEIIGRITALDEVVSRTDQYFKRLGTPKFLSFNSWIKKYLIWKEGYEIMMAKWDNLKKILELKSTGVEGEVFNPSFHEAISVEQKSNLANNHIIECIELGYLYKGILIKRAKVIVNKFN